MSLIKFAAVFLLLLCVLFTCALVALIVQKNQDQSFCSTKLAELRMEGMDLEDEIDLLRQQQDELSRLYVNLTQRVKILRAHWDQLRGNHSQEMMDRERYKKEMCANATCPADWKQFGNMCYFFSESRKYWRDSKLDCEQKGAQLVSISTEDQQKFLSAFGSRWIGLSDQGREGNWIWLDGTSPILTYWKNGQPDNYRNTEHCAEATPLWNDLPCSGTYKRAWICAKKLF